MADYGTIWPVPTLDEEELTPLAHRIPGAARRAAVSQRTLRRWIDKGLLPSATIGGVRLILEADLRRFLDAHRR